MDKHVVDIIRRELGSAPLSCQRFPGGQCDVYAVRAADSDYVLKLARPGEHWRTRHEAAVYALLPERSQHLLVANVDEGYLLMRSAGPMNLANRFKQPGDHGQLFRQMGRHLRQLHETPLADVPPTIRLALTAARDRLLDVVRRDAPKRYAAADDSAGHRACWPLFEAMIERAIAADGKPLCLLHGDYNTRQVVLNAGGTAITAIVDYEYACHGPAVLDLVRMEMSGVRGRDAFYTGYGPADLRRRHIRLFTALDCLHEAIASGASDPAKHKIAIGGLHRAIQAASADV